MRFPSTMDPTRCDLHIHTDYSDAVCTVSEVVKRAAQMRLQAIAITDHFWPSLGSRQKGKGVIDRRREEIVALRLEHPEMAILDGAEVDINFDGTVAPVAGGLDQFDLVIGSVHRGSDSITWSRAICRVLEKAHFDILGHWDGYLRTYRHSDGTTVAKALAEHEVAIELSTRYPIEYVEFLEIARDMGCIFTLGSDSHSADSIGDLTRPKKLAEAYDLPLLDIEEAGLLPPPLH
ncbi:PHP domain-containing protein [Candidatus Thorarchaeota archaeon]|nr:MAG: PHP domain-containing protein [Candidatus Thorarchaeota archaeon]